jgi:hypothetical protein
MLEKIIVHAPDPRVVLWGMAALTAHCLEFPGLCRTVAWAQASAAATTIAISRVRYTAGKTWDRVYHYPPALVFMRWLLVIDRARNID